MIDESAFIDRAVTLLSEISGEDLDAIDGDTALLGAEFFDSLVLISFLAFLEEQRGSSLPISPTDGIPFRALATIRAAYWHLVAVG